MRNLRYDSDQKSLCQRVGDRKFNRLEGLEAINRSIASTGKPWLYCILFNGCKALANFQLPAIC